VLFIAYQFPPVGGAGVQRTTKFIKYLRGYGWEASVLTVANPSVPVLDDSLRQDVPESTLVRRARTLEPGYALKTSLAVRDARPGREGLVRRILKGGFRRLSTLALQPDPQVLWLPAALREGTRLLREVSHQAIFVTGPPFSSFLLGAALSRRTGLPLVLDYRDEWEISNAYWENKRLGPLSRLLQRGMQNRVLRQASGVVATTRASADSLEAAVARARSSARVACIYNGFDPQDFTAPSAPPATAATTPAAYRLGYVGTLWNLTSVVPLVEGIRLLAARSPELAARLEVELVGRRTASQTEALGGLNGLPCRVVQRGYVEHREALEVLHRCDGLCSLLSDVPGANRVVPAKVFEHMAARREVLVIAPRGELWDVVRGYPLAHCHEPSDVTGIAATLERLVLRQREERTLTAWDGSPYDRRSQAGQLADLLAGLLAAPDARGPDHAMQPQLSHNCR
jgi:glycosyltransferase involved in cell wall biosynthesis